MTVSTKMLLPLYVLAIDPAIHKTGIALFQRDNIDYVVRKTCTVEVSPKIKGERACVEMIRNVVEHLWRDPKVTVDLTNLVIEIQKPHKNDRMSVQAFSHLTSIPIGIMAILHREMRQHTQMYTPSQWKGNVKKDVMLKHIYTQEICNGTDPNLFSMKKPDILDAIGLGRFYIEKLQYKRRISQL